MLISHPGSDYQVTQVTLDAGNARDIIMLLTDVRSVLACLRAGSAAGARTLLRDTGSPYTLPALIQALDDVAALLGDAERRAVQGIPGMSTGD